MALGAKAFGEALGRPAAIVAAGAALHLALALATDLSPDEAYYLCAARAPGWRPPLVDHPPLVAWALRLTDGLTLLPVELRVRLWAIGGAALLAILVARLAEARALEGGKDAEGGRRAARTAAALATFAILPTAGGFVTGPDTLALPGLALVLLWAGAPSVPRPLAAALGVGAVAALAVLSKVVALPLVAVTCLAAPRRSLPERALVLGLALLPLPLAAPSLAFQLGHAYVDAPAAPTAAGRLAALASALLAQLLLWTPWVLGRAAGALGLLALPDRALLAAITALVVASALIRGVAPEANWWAPGALVAIVACAVSSATMPAVRRRAMLAAVVAPTWLAAAHVAHPFLPIPPENDPTARLHGWSESSSTPRQAPGVGPYGPAAEACIYLNHCEEITNYFNKMTGNYSNPLEPFATP